MMNDIIDHTYDLTLNDANFESYINATYGSYPRASGVSANLTYYITPDGADNPNSGINSESHPTEVTYEAQTFDKQIDLVTGLVSDDTTRPRHTGAYGDVVDSSASGNTSMIGTVIFTNSAVSFLRSLNPLRALMPALAFPAAFLCTSRSIDSIIALISLLCSSARSS